MTRLVRLENRLILDQHKYANNFLVHNCYLIRPIGSFVCFPKLIQYLILIGKCSKKVKTNKLRKLLKTLASFVQS